MFCGKSFLLQNDTSSQIKLAAITKVLIFIGQVTKWRIASQYRAHPVWKNRCNSHFSQYSTRRSDVSVGHECVRGNKALADKAYRFGPPGEIDSLASPAHPFWGALRASVVALRAPRFELEFLEMFNQGVCSILWPIINKNEWPG